ncbi:MAG: hypothetical protein ACK4PI_03915 [Tepidisphaerales bacterium]
MALDLAHTRTFRSRLADAFDRVRGWLFFSLFLFVAATLWFAAWARSIARDREVHYLAPAYTWHAVEEADGEEVWRVVPRTNAGLQPVVRADDRRVGNVGSDRTLQAVDELPATRPSEVVRLDVEP